MQSKFRAYLPELPNISIIKLVIQKIWTLHKKSHINMYPANVSPQFEINAWTSWLSWNIKNWKWTQSHRYYHYYYVLDFFDVCLPALVNYECQKHAIANYYFFAWIVFDNIITKNIFQFISKTTHLKYNKNKNIVSISSTYYKMQKYIAINILRLSVVAFLWETRPFLLAFVIAICGIFLRYPIKYFLSDFHKIRYDLCYLIVCGPYWINYFGVTS